MKNILREMKWEAVMSALLYMALGVVLMIFPDTTAQMICYVGGGAIIVVGVITIISYFLKDVYKSYYKNDFMIGLIEMLLGLFVIYRSDLVMALVPFVLGIFVMVSGFSKLQDCINLKRMKYSNWYVFLILSALNMILGLVLLINPFEAATTLLMAIGIGLVFSGVSDLVTTVYISQKVRYFVDKSALVDADGESVREEKTEASQEKNDELPYTYPPKEPESEAAAEADVTFESEDESEKTGGEKPTE